ncbi:MAG: Rqc2 family fibronectin-binding protein [Saccharofermentanales bacterium]
MPLDGITAKFLSYELSNELVGARIDKISQPDQFDIYLKLRNDNRNLQLIISANPSTARLHVTGADMPNPLIPLRFCMILRKYLSGGRIISVETPGYERIFIIKIQTVNELGDKDIKTLVVEIMSRYSNIILLNENNMIIDSAVHVDDQTSRVREVLPAHMYIAPPSQNKSSLEEFAACMISDLDSGRLSEQDIAVNQYLLDNITGVSPLFVQEFCFLSNIDIKEKINALTKDQISGLVKTISFFIDEIKNRNYKPALFFKAKEAFAPADFHAFSLHIFPEKKEFDSLSVTMDEFYTRKALQNFLSQKKAYLVKVINQKEATLAKKIIIHQNDLEECKSRDLYRKYGDLILSNLNQFQKDRNLSEIAVTDYYEMSAPELLIPLQSNLTGSQNAQKYYKRYNKLKSRSEIVAGLLEEERAELEYIQSISVSLMNVETSQDIDAIKDELTIWDKNFNQKNKTPEHVKHSGKKKKAVNKKPVEILFRHYKSSDGFEIFAGRNNLQNDQLSTKISRKDDIWFHIQKAPGAHVVVRTNNMKLPENTIMEAAMIAAWLSKKSDAAIDTKVTIDYCLIKNIWKPKNSVPGHVLYKDFESINVKTRFPDGVTDYLI